MTRSEDAVARFDSGLNCSQAVLAAFAADYGLEEQSACRVAAGFGGGVGRTGGICGAVTGAIMVLGLAHCSIDHTDPIAKAQLYNRIQRFLEEFSRKTGALSCKDLLGCDIGTPEGFDRARAEGLFEIQCPEYVREAAEILETML